MKRYRIVKNYDSWFNVDVPNEENTEYEEMRNPRRPVGVLVK